ncbi:MAG: RHS repeat-associated core domain-containing protein, partial [Verrucomicrobiota bacterium]
NNTVSYTAYGHVNGQSTLSAWLDNQPVSVIGVGTNAMQWRSAMELSSGAHQLKIAAAHPSGIFTAWATNTFTNSIAYQTTGDVYDNAGNITQRVWRNANGTTNRTQTLSWDARGRLHQVTERDAGNSGYNWTAIYDGLNRRLLTTSVLVTNGVAFNSQPTTINSYFDPQVEFLELGVAYGTKTEWKLYGPDLNGVYGGLNGTGGFDGVSSFLNLFYPVISDFRGNILGVVTNGVVSWNPARPTGYGAVPAYRPLALGNGADISLSSAWRGRWVDITGYHQIGLRPYDPVSGRWLTYDSVWNERDPNYYSFAGGEPIMSFDADGRCASAVANYAYNGGLAGQTLRGLGGYLDSYQTDNAAVGAATGYYGSLANSVGGMITPSAYVNGLHSFGNNINSVYQSGGVVDATSYALTSWNMGGVMAAIANQNQLTGAPLGDWLGSRGAEFAGGVAGTAGVAAGGLGVYNWAAAPAATTTTVAPAAADITPTLVGNVPDAGNTWRTAVYNTENQQIWIGGEQDIFHLQVLGDATENGGWRLVGNSANEQYVGGNAHFVNGQLVDFNTASGHLPGTPALQSEAQSAASAIMNR